MFEEMPQPERVRAFVSLTKKYEHRIVLPLSKDTFGLEAHLKDNAADFARVPFQSIDAAYYLLNGLQAVKRLLDFLPPGLNLSGYRNPWDDPRVLVQGHPIPLSRTEFEAERAEADDVARRAYAEAERTDAEAKRAEAERAESSRPLSIARRLLSCTAAAVGRIGTILTRRQ